MAADIDELMETLDGTHEQRAKTIVEFLQPLLRRDSQTTRNAVALAQVEATLAVVDALNKRND